MTRKHHHSSTTSCCREVLRAPPVLVLNNGTVQYCSKGIYAQQYLNRADLQTSTWLSFTLNTYRHSPATLDQSVQSRVVTLVLNWSSISKSSRVSLGVLRFHWMEGTAWNVCSPRKRTDRALKRYYTEDDIFPVQEVCTVLSPKETSSFKSALLFHASTY